MRAFRDREATRYGRTAKYTLHRGPSCPGSKGRVPPSEISCWLPHLPPWAPMDLTYLQDLTMPHKRLVSLFPSPGIGPLSLSFSPFLYSPPTLA